MTDKMFLRWIYNRMVNLHHENEDVDYMRKFNDVINSMTNIPVSDDLEKEAHHAAMRMLNNTDLMLPSTTNADLLRAYQKLYKEAADWQRQRDIKKTCEWIKGFTECCRLFEYQVTESEQKEIIDDFLKTTAQEDCPSVCDKTE